MGETRSPKRPWLAAVLALAVTGLGHAYLRRWGRAFGWLALVYAALALFVPPEAVTAASEGLRGGSMTLPASVDPLVFLPPLIAALGSVADAYLLARADRDAALRANDAEDHRTCPNCGREVDEAIDFCQWCTTRLVDPAGEADEDEPGQRGRAE
ncbi:zinc ribbon domain-containing protein [Halorarum halobium]|uniref:zinc ribbon domain-containing protein n=1 Tax=Halorarum halobium TaxID=3075121 RepID=UPI0028ABD3D8|nr:zinc ribbon domain-containing protein [Halobaculum sp. XH14]